jgi:hypothetical protein
MIIIKWLCELAIDLQFVNFIINFCNHYLGKQTILINRKEITSSHLTHNSQIIPSHAIKISNK